MKFYLITNATSAGRTVLGSPVHGQNLGTVTTRTISFRKNGEHVPKTTPNERLFVGFETSSPTTEFAVRVVRDGTTKNVRREQGGKYDDGVVFFERGFNVEADAAGNYRTMAAQNCLHAIRIEVDGTHVVAVNHEHAITVQRGHKFYTCQEVGTWKLFKDAEGKIWSPDREWPEYMNFLTNYLNEKTKEKIPPGEKVPFALPVPRPTTPLLTERLADIPAIVKRWHAASNYGILTVVGSDGDSHDVRIALENTDCKVGEFYELTPGEQVVIKQISLPREKSFAYEAYGLTSKDQDKTSGKIFSAAEIAALQKLEANQKEPAPPPEAAATVLSDAERRRIAQIEQEMAKKNQVSEGPAFSRELQDKFAQLALAMKLNISLKDPSPAVAQEVAPAPTVTTPPPPVKAPAAPPAAPPPDIASLARARRARVGRSR